MSLDSGLPNPTAIPVKPRSQIQFSIKTLLFLMTAVACAFAAIAAPEVIAVAAIILHLAFSVALLVSVIYARGWLRSFAVGCIPAHAIAYVAMLDGMRPEGIIIMGALMALASCLSGTVAAVVYSALAKRNFRLPPPNLPFLRDWISNPPQK